MWTIVARIILRNRILILTILGLMTIFMGYNAKKIQLSYEYASLLPKKDSAYIEYQNFKNSFGEDATALVIGIQDKNLFELDKFNDFKSLNDSIKGLDGIEAVASVSKVQLIVKDQKNKQYAMASLFEEEITSQEQLNKLADSLRLYPFYENSFYNDTSGVALLIVTFNKEKLNSKAREGIIDNLEETVEKFTAKYNLEPHYSGLPYIRTKTALKLKKELVMFIVFAALITMVILFMFFRSFKVVAFCMLVVGVGVTWVIGWMGLFDFHVTILSALIPPLIIVIGVPNCVFLLNKYHAEYVKHGNQTLALQRVIRKIGNATFLTNLTTASGFATFIITSSTILKEFGLIAFLGIMGVFVFSILLIPIIFSLAKPPSEKQVGHLENKLVNKMIDWFIHVCEYKRKQLYTISIIIFALGIVGITLMKSTGYIVDDLPKHDPIYSDLKFFEKHFGGVMPLEIMIDTEKRRGLMKPAVMKKMDKLQDKILEYKEVSRPVSYVDFIKFARQAYYNGNSKYYNLPSSLERGEIFGYFGKTDNKLKNAFVDSTMSKARLSLNVADVGTEKMQELEMSIKADIDSIFGINPEEKITVTGSSIIFVKGTSYLLENLFISLCLAILLIGTFMAWMFYSWRMVIVSLIPNLFPLIMTAALMGYIGIPIKPSTILVFSIAFGISVDDTIHFLAKYRQELKHTNWNIGDSVLLALKETGMSMFYTSIVLFFGFGIFVASEFGGTIALGALVSATLLIAMISNLLLLPSLILSLEKMLTNKSFKEPYLHIFDEEEDIELEELRIEGRSPSVEQVEENLK